MSDAAKAGVTELNDTVPGRTTGPGSKPRVHLDIIETLAMRILGGEFPPGALLPKQDQLSKDLSVSRSSVREAVRVLASKGLVESKPRAGMRVRPRHHWNMLDTSVLAWLELAPDAALEAGRLRAFVEARQAIEPAAAELAARHATAADIAAIEQALQLMKAAPPGDVDSFLVADLAFHSAMLMATHNFVFAQLVSTMAAALRAVMRTTTTLARSHDEALLAHGEVLECIRSGDTAGARSAMSGVLGISLRVLQTARKM